MSRGDTAERAAESLLAIVAIWLYDEKWICLTSSGQHKDVNSKRGDPGAKLAGGLAEQHQPATTCILLLSQPPWILFPPAPSSSLTSLICIPAISYSHSSYLHLICPSHSLNSMWRQLCGLSCKCCFHSVAVLIFQVLQERRLTASFISARQPKMTFFLHL